MAKKKSSRKSFKKRLLLSIFIFALSITLIIFTVHISYKKIVSVVETNCIYENIFVNGIDVGGLNQNDAFNKINTAIQKPIDKKIITFKDDNGSQYQFTFKDFNAAYNIKDAVQKAYDYARSGKLLKRYEQVVKLRKNPVKITAAYGFSDEFVKSKLGELESKVYVKPINATVYRQNNKFVTVAGKSGRKLNLEQTFARLKTLLANKQEGSVDLVFDEVKPFYNESDFDNVKDVLGSYTTNFNGSNSGRNTNIINAARKINNCVVYPAEVFSTNNALKPFTEKNGYQSAAVIVDGKIVDDLGGGICQVSTALYNAVLYSELKVVQRQNHSLKVGYADYGYDATLAGDYIDFQFKNSTKSPILIESIVSGTNLTVKIYGAENRDPNRKIKFENALVSVIEPPADTITYTNELPDGEKKVIAKAKKGYKYKLYKLVYKDGKQIEKVQVNSSYYKPVRGSMQIGTKKN